MGNSVASAIVGPDAQAFWAGMEKLKKDFGLTPSEIKTFVTGSVASHLKKGGMPTILSVCSVALTLRKVNRWYEAPIILSQ
jgi:hypothetical protein